MLLPPEQFSPEDYFTHPQASSVTLAKGPNARKLNSTAEHLLKSILAASGVMKATYTSTGRTYEDQARILFQKSKAEVEDLRYYKGDPEFVRQFVKFKNNNDRQGFADYMRNRDKKNGTLVSNHISSYAIDIPLNSKVNNFLRNKTAATLKGFKRYLQEYSNNCTHIEFTFPVLEDAEVAPSNVLKPNSNGIIHHSVGEKGHNERNDVATIQYLLNLKAEADLKVDGIVGPLTIAAIKKYQHEVLNMSNPDGRVDVNGPTWNSLLKALAA